MAATLKAQLHRLNEKPPGEPRLAEIGIALSHARCGLTKLYRLIAEGHIDAFKDGKRTLVDLNSSIAITAACRASLRARIPSSAAKARRRRQRHSLNKKPPGTTPAAD